MGANTLVIIAAVLAFVTVGGLGMVFAGGGGSQAKALKRAQTVAGGRTSKIERANSARAAANDPNARRKQIIKTLKEQDKQARKATVTMEARLRQAGLSITTRTFWITSAAVGVVLMILGFAVKPDMPLIALGMGFAGGLGLPRWVIGFLGKRRLKKFTESFSDAIDIIVRGIRSGLPVHDCLKIIGREVADPVGGEFTRLVESLGMGMSVDQALEKMFERIPTPELRFFAIVMSIQAKSGGNLAEALANLSQVLRARKLMREKIKALSAEAVASAFIIGCLPPGVVLLISVTSPAYMSKMYTDPRGQMMLLGGALWMAMGIFVMRKMINFKH